MNTNLESESESRRARWRRPFTLTALIPLSGETETVVRARLAALAPQLEKALVAVKDLHAFRLVVAPPEAATNPAGLRLLLNSVHDLPLAQHLADLVAAAGELLAQALHGANFSGQPSAIPELLGRCRAHEHTFHLGVINQSVPEILAGQRLLETIETYADAKMTAGAWPVGTDAEMIRREIRDYILAQQPERALPRGPLPELAPEAKWLRFLDLLVTFAFPFIGVLTPHIVSAIRRIKSPALRGAAWIGFGLWWIYGGIATGIALLIVSIVELFEPDPPAPPPDSAKVERIEATEDLILKNAVTLWFTVRNSWIRRVLTKVILWGSERGCRHFWTAGALADIDTIHYARILHLDGCRTMLFMSDYDGSLDRYLIDFLGVGSSAVIPISSNASGCPKTRLLFFPADRATFGPRWRRLIRSYQLEMSVWYSAYPDLSVRDVLANAAFRDGLFATEMNAADATAWLTRI